MKSLSGVWVHPADGDNYPLELKMTVTEVRGIGVLGWTTLTDYGDRVSEWQYAHGQGSHHILYAVKRADGTWGPTTTMHAERWGVPDGKSDTARKVLEEFFTEGGYTREQR